MTIEIKNREGVVILTVPGDDLQGSTLWYANLQGADLRGATFWVIDLLDSYF